MAKYTRYEMIANQLMKSCNERLTKVAGSEEEIKNFCKKYDKIIRYLDENFPKDMSVGVAGAVGKAILWYGFEEMEPFCQRFIKRTYKGADDPVHVLWQWLILNDKRKTKETYRRTVTAIRAYVRNASISTSRGFREAQDDIFEWEDDYTVMFQARRNQHSKTSGERKIPSLE